MGNTIRQCLITTRKSIQKYYTTGSDDDNDDDNEDEN